jgi:hypothetical protein
VFEPLPLKRRLLLGAVVACLLAAGTGWWWFLDEPEWATELRGELVFTRRDDDGVLRLQLLDLRSRKERELFAGGDATNANVLAPRWDADGKRVSFWAMHHGDWARHNVASDGGDLKRDAPSEAPPSSDSHAPDLQVRRGDLLATRGGSTTMLYRHSAYDAKLNRGASEARWGPDKRHAIFQACTGRRCRVLIARADGSGWMAITQGRQPDWR